MFSLVFLFYLASETLTRTTPPIFSLFTGAGAYPHDDPSSLLLSFSRDVPQCACPSDQRSIWGITWSCLATLFLCSWVSVHLDVPGHGEKWWRSWLRRMEYMFWTLVTPEMIICWASRQWAGARRIQKEQQKHGWTVTHGHFMQMGGFMLFKGKKRQGTLSYDRFLELLKQGRIQFPDITQEEIEDKSKSDGLSKTLVVGQTMWFVLQCIARTAQRLPITKLELSTLAFAALNGFMCFFWWNKPFGVQTPVPVYLIEPTAPDLISSPFASSSRSPLLLGGAEESVQIRDFFDFNQFRHSIINWSGWGKLITWPWTLLLFVGHRLRSMNEDEAAIRAFNLQGEREKDIPGPMRVPTFYSLVASDDDLLYLAVPCVGFLYGAIHCAAWNFDFPTVTELWLWRVSSVVIAAVPFLVLFLVYLVLVFSMEARHWIVYSITVVMVFILLTAYVLGRFIILAESISTLRHLPPGAFAVVQWTLFLPHL